MGKYLDIPFEGIKNPFDGHIHLHQWKNTETGQDFLHGFEEYRKACGLKYIALAPLPSGNAIPVPRDVSNNIICAFYKMLNEDTFSYGGYIYPSYPAKMEQMEGMDLLTQYNELMEIGFDGIKMLEGKPNLYIRVGNRLDSELFDKAFAQMEKDGTYVLMHALDPAWFWTEADPERVAKKWYYGTDEYPSIDDLYGQIDNIMEKYPKLNLCLAHLFFCSEQPEKLEKMFEKYENLMVDITPGGEMYIAFAKRPEYYKEFFKKYSDRICFGTDMDHPVYLECGVWLCDREYRFFASDEEISSFANVMIKGIDLPKEHVQKIFSDNLLTKLGGKPKPINKEALKRYIAKYEHLIIDTELKQRIHELSEQYL